MTRALLYSSVEGFVSRKKKKEKKEEKRKVSPRPIRRVRLTREIREIPRDFEEKDEKRKKEKERNLSGVSFEGHYGREVSLIELSIASRLVSSRRVIIMLRHAREITNGKRD